MWFFGTGSREASSTFFEYSLIPPKRTVAAKPPINAVELVETHNDRNKGDGKERQTTNGINEEMLIHRLHSAIENEGNLFDVELVVYENANKGSLKSATESFSS